MQRIPGPGTTDDYRRLPFQLVVTTLGRVPELERLLASIESQTEEGIHVVVADQSNGSEVAALCRRYSSELAISYVHSESGASRGRNAGIRHVQAVPGGDRIVTFPDDDCWYPPTLLADVRRLLDANQKWDGCTGRSPLTGRWDLEAGLVTRGNVWRRGVAFTIFVRESVVARVGLFDETLGSGTGTAFGSGEETDYLLRALADQFVLSYDPALIVHHLDTLGNLNADAFAKSRRYGMGMGRVLKKHRYGLAFVAYVCVRPLGGAALSLACGRAARARYHWESFLGRVLGVLAPDAHGD